MVRDISHIDNYPQTDYNFIKRLVGRIFYEVLKIVSLFLVFLLGCQLALPAFADGSCLIYFETSDGTGVPVIVSTTSSGKLSQLPTPTMSDYTFEGWHTDELEGDKITLNTEFGADATIYAHWVPT